MFALWSLVFLSQKSHPFQSVTLGFVLWTQRDLILIGSRQKQRQFGFVSIDSQNLNRRLESNSCKSSKHQMFSIESFISSNSVGIIQVSSKSFCIKTF